MEAALLFGVAAGEAPISVALVCAAEFFGGGRIAARCGSVAHSGQFCRAEEL
jgi:hypothetical protein